MGAKKSLLIAALAVLSATAHAQIFREGWQTSQIAEYTPTGSTFISGDEGFWFVGDTVSQVPTCGRTPHRAEILIHNGSRALRLLSNRSFSDCQDDVFVLLSQLDSFNIGFGVPLLPGTVISFDEEGELVDPGPHDVPVNCLLPPCFDNVSLLLTDNSGNILAYVLQRFPGAVENVANENFGDTYREIFLDPDAGSYRRNVFNDFEQIPTFNPVDAQIESIEFRVDEHGVAILDNLVIGLRAPAGAVPVYRFWSPILKCHFFTASESERQKLLNDFAAVWTPEGIGWYALPGANNPSVLPVYRFWSPVLSSHFYTLRESERDKLLEQFPDVWTPEGIAFYAFPEGAQPVGTNPVYRFWSEQLDCHFYTISETERDKLINNFLDVWISEGVAWYAYVP